jgi:hypothetical protein
VIAGALTVRSRLPRRKLRTAVLSLHPLPSMDRPGINGSYVGWPLRQSARPSTSVSDFGAVLSKGAHDKRLHTSELAQAALDGAGAPLLAIWPRLVVEALDVLDPIHRHCPRPSVAAPLAGVVL